MRYRHLFFDLDHTLWDFDANARLTLQQLYNEMALAEAGVHDFELFHKHYLAHNEKLWARFRNGYIKAEELRWKRMWHTLLEFRNGNEQLAKALGARFLELLPSRTLLFADAVETLNYLHNKGYHLHLITNGFEETQHLKLKSTSIDIFFRQVITSEGSNSVKPNREIFDYALAKAGALASESIMIGDSLEVDIIGAMNAGLDQVFVNHSGIAYTIQPTFVVNSLKELQEIF